MNEINVSTDNVTDFTEISQLNSDVFQSTLIPSFIYTWILLLIGIPGNALVCYVYQFKIRNKQFSSNIFILALSWFDLINCVVSLPIEIKFILNSIQFDEPVLCKLSRFLTFFCNNASSMILLAIAIDRLVAFLSGHVRRRLKPYMAKALVVAAICISAGVSWPMLLFFGTYTFPISSSIYGKSCLITNKYVKSQEVVTFTISLLSLHILFDVAFLVIYSIIGKKICYDSGFVSLQSASNGQGQLIRLKSKRESESSNDEIYVTQDDILKSRSPSPSVKKIDCLGTEQRNGNKLTVSAQNSFEISKNNTSTESDNSGTSLWSNTCSFPNQKCHRTSDCKIFNRRTTASRTSFMLFMVTMAYVISFMPYCVIVVIRHVSSESFYLGLSNTEKAMYQLFLRSYALSSAINPIIYSFINYSFRQKCKCAIKDILCYFRTKNINNV